MFRFRRASVVIAAFAATWLSSASIAMAPPSEAEFQAQLEAERQKAKENAPKTFEEEIARARSFLDDNLVEYDRAKIRGMYRTESTIDNKARFLGIPVGTKIPVFCGEINSPNRMGGFTGWQKVAILLQGRDYAPLIFENSKITEYYSLCPSGGTGEDISSKLLPDPQP
jgi:hypothetical protein